MKSWFNGREALAEMDSLLARIRKALADALESADGIEARRGAIHRDQASAYNALAVMRLDLMHAAQGGAAFGEIESAAFALTERHDAFVAAETAALELAAAEVSRLEGARAGLAAQLDAAIAAYESKVAATEADLKGSAPYAELVQTAEDARAVTLRAEQKLALAKSDRTGKGAPYEQDALFSYLWKRKWRSPEYQASGLIRMLDAWVAKLCRYDAAFLNYQRLTELPERIAEHVAFVASLEDKSETALIEAEQAAMLQAGVGALKTGAEARKAEVAACDARIAAAEELHRATALRHEAALREEAGPAVEARALLESALRNASFPGLRVLAAETLDTDDDRIVDQLVRLRAEEMSIDLEADKRLQRPRVMREDLERMEALRRQFKEARFDSPYALMPRAVFDEMISGIGRGEIDVKDALRGLSRSVRRAEPQAHPEFGGRSRHETIGVPDVLGGVLGGVLGDVLEEVMRETTRGGGPIFPGPPSRSSRSSRPPSIGGRSFPRGGGGGGRRGGGFKTGGGF